MYYFITFLAGVLACSLACAQYLKLSVATSKEVNELNKSLLNNNIELGAINRRLIELLDSKIEDQHAKTNGQQQEGSGIHPIQAGS